MNGDFDLKVGDVVRTKFAVMGNSVGSVGIVFEDYGTGAQIIFPNGEYCGWGVEEFDTLEKFELPRRIPMHDQYVFSNVINVRRDFRNGTWSWTQIYAQFQRGNPANPAKGNVIEKLQELLTDINAPAMVNPAEFAHHRLMEINRLTLAMIHTIEEVQRKRTITRADVAQMQESDRDEEHWISHEYEESRNG